MSFRSIDRTGQMSMIVTLKPEMQNLKGHLKILLGKQVPLMLLALLFVAGCKPKAENEFTRLTNAGKNYYDKGEAAKAIPLFEQALQAKPSSADAQLNLAIACLAAGQPDKALLHARKVLAEDAYTAAAHYLMGCAFLRQGQPKSAVQELAESKRLDRTVNAVTFQLGRAYQQLAQWTEAAQAFQEVVQFEPDHPAANYTLSQVLSQLGQTNEAAQALQQHQTLQAEKRIKGQPPFEQCRYTQIHAPFQLEQPTVPGVKVVFADATATAFGNGVSPYRGPAGVIDFANDGRNSLLVSEGDKGFRLLINSNGVFQPAPNLLTNIPGVRYSQALTGDLNNDGVADIVMLGDKGSQVFKFATNGTVSDVSVFSRLRNVSATNGLLTDLEFSSKLDLLAVTAETNALRPFRNLGHPYFSDISSNFPALTSLSGVRQIFADDWNNDDLLDLFVTREGQAPLLLLRQRGGSFVATNVTPEWPKGSAIAVADLNNDLRTDLVVASGGQLVCIFNGLTERANIQLGNWPVNCLLLGDYDNDGWLDIIAGGQGLRIWRNHGGMQFKEATASLGLDKLGKREVKTLTPADFDNDGDTDLLVTFADQSLQLLRNDGGNANLQVKVRLIGSRSNASGLGCRIEASAGGLRLARRVSELPIEIGVGKHETLESLTARWASLNLNYVDVKVEPRSLVVMQEASIRDGSCPFFYAWDGKQFRFVTDILGAAPLGLPVAEGRFVDADPEEYVWIGNEGMFPPRAGEYVLQITEELREVLYLDEAKLVVVDHPPGSEVHTTGKMVPGKPFPRHELITLHGRKALLHASNHEQREVTGLLQEADGKYVSPTRFRIPQLCGLAEPSSVTLDFGPLDVSRPLVLALTGWLRFGGGTVNICAAHDPALPFPFPKLEVESAGGEWKAVDVMVGVPAGKTKSMVVELSGKLPPGSRRLRLSTAYELHWDRIALFEKRDNAETHITVVPATRTDLHWHGYGEYENLPWYFPLTPSHEKVSEQPLWRITPTGWCTRYGEVSELINQRDNALALINGGDELTLFFASSQMPSKSAGQVRDFFLYSVGWDKDADFHCELGWQVGPLPWRGMDDQQYGKQTRPAFPSDRLMEKYTTRWVGPRTIAGNVNRSKQR